jgi:hypothetical protein
MIKHEMNVRMLIKGLQEECYGRHRRFEALNDHTRMRVECGKITELDKVLNHLPPKWDGIVKYEAKI